MIYKIVFLVSLLYVSCAHASPIEETFLKANQEYAAHHYEKALELYNVIDGKGCATWHNMGNCAAHLKKPIDALVYWRRAQRGCSFSEFDELQKNIDGVYGQLGKTQSRGTWSRFVDKVVHRYSLLFFQLFFLLVWGLLFLVIWLNRRYKKGILLILIPFNFICGAAVVTKYKTHTCPCALVVQDNATLFAGPDSSYQVMGTVGVAEELKIIEQRGAWCKARSQNLAGWVLADTLKIL